MFVVSYVMIVAFHPELQLNRIVIQRSYVHSLEQLTSLNYFTQEQINFLDNTLIKMLNDIAFDVAKIRCKNTMGQMFCIETALVKKTLLNWFNKKYRPKFNQISPIQKIIYEKQNPVNWKTDKCVVCKYPLKIEPTSFKTPDDEMSFGDFLIRYEHKFLRHIYANQQIEESLHLKDLKSYYEIFEEYIAISIGLLALLNNYNRSDFINCAVKKFVEDKFYGDEITEIKNTITQTEAKSALSSTFGKVPKFNLKIYGYVYDELIRSDTAYESIATNKFFTNVH